MANAISGDTRRHTVRSTSLGRDVLAGAIAGQIAGLIMAAVLMLVYAVFLGTSPLYPVQVIGSFAIGEEALVGFHLGAFLTGLLLHQLGPSLVWGAAFGYAAHKLDIRRGARLAALAIGIGILAQIVDVYLLVGPLMNALHGHNIWAEQVPSFWSWAAHIVFGLGLLSFPAVRDRLAHRHNL